MDGPDLDLLCAAAFPEGRLLFLNAAPHPALAAVRDRLTCVQRWKPTADALARAGFAAGEISGTYAGALVRLGRQREVNRAMLAAALDALGPAGELRVAGTNALGAASYEKDLRALGPRTGCRAARPRRGSSATARGAADPAAWSALAAPRTIAGTDFLSAPGVFAWDRIDVGSAAPRAANLPDGLAGTVADLGAGWGYLAHTPPSPGAPASRGSTRSRQTRSRSTCMRAQS